MPKVQKKPRHLHHNDAGKIDSINVLLMDRPYMVRLLAACEKCSEINCGWQTYEMAQALIPIVRYAIAIKTPGDTSRDSLSDRLVTHYRQQATR